MKAAIIFAIIGIFAVSANGSTLNSSPDLNPFDYLNFGDIFHKYMQAFKRIMPCGYAPWNVPILAPYTVDHWDFDYSGDDYSLVGSLSNLYVEGINDWQTLQTSYNTTTQQYKYDVFHSNLQILAEYKINATVTIANMPFTYVGEGVLNWKFTDSRAIAGFTFQSINDNQVGLEITDFKMQVLLGDVQANNWNNYWNNEVNNFVNRWLRKYVLLWTEEAQSYIPTAFAKYVLPSLNPALAELSMTELLEILVGLTMELDEVKC
ncbi:uncharacterized protein LOC119684061 [Teleopsis dalmanni]|uniref:uncharacterized protein LOC119684061 n=1 Tax=Teleopsis dalmanni TaxID=139649 RepID=UPI0018CD7640|nr:uncharacterized protein LOC119684061 [Teleopsis dalmanni]